MKGQTEILGFAMIVLIVSVGMLFIISFVVLNSDTDIKRTFTDKQLAVNMNDALLSSTSGCKKLTYEDLIKNCAEGNDIVCSSDPLLRSCEYVENALSGIFAQTLEVWQKDYQYRVYFDGEVCQYSSTQPELAEGCLIGPIIDGPSECRGELEPGIFICLSTGRRCLLD